jgi:hypothetical protein
MEEDSKFASLAPEENNNSSFRLPEEDKMSSNSFPLILVLVVALCGSLLLVCGGLSIYCWRRTTKNRTTNLDSEDNESKYYDDFSSTDYYYETVHAPEPQYVNFNSSRRPDSARELPRRPEIQKAEIHNLCEFKGYDYVCNDRNRESDSDSYIHPETAATGE